MTGDKLRGAVWRERAKLYGMRVASAAITVVAVYLIVRFGGLYALAAAGMGSLVALMLPGIGDLMSVFTLWSGYAVSSCPNCPEVGFGRVSVLTRTCDWCGDVEHQIAIHGGHGWTRRRRDGEWFEYCTRGCIDSHNNALEAENAT